jgi:hypothetical protein
MAHKTFICSVCGETVTKPGSYALPNGTRACRKHEEAQSAHEKTVADDEARRQQEKIDQDRRNTGSHSMHKMYNVGCHCLRCKAKAVDKSTLAALRLDCMALAKAKNEDQISLDPDAFVNRLFALAVKEQYGTDLVVVSRFATTGLEDWKIKQLVGDGETAMVVKLVGAVALCDKCANEFGFKSNQPTIEQIVAFAPIAETIVNDKAEFFKNNM